MPAHHTHRERSNATAGIRVSAAHYPPRNSITATGAKPIFAPPPSPPPGCGERHFSLRVLGRKEGSGVGAGFHRFWRFGLISFFILYSLSPRFASSLSLRSSILGRGRGRRRNFGAFRHAECYSFHDVLSRSSSFFVDN